EVANLCFDANKIAGLHSESRSMFGVNPERVRVRDFVKPFCICAARVNLRRQAKSLDENGLVLR
ncbi:MAG: hypothetical protein WCB68_22715, partial [Pyrinomonadaceae bacterium]